MSEAWPLPRDAGDRDRSAILHAAAAIASAEGLDGVSIGGLAAATRTSKSGLRALFGSTQGLQLAVVEEAARIFTDEVVRPALAAPSGLPQLAAVCEAFFEHLERGTFPGGSFMAGLALDVNGRPGPAADLIAGFQSRFGTLIRGFAAAAVDRDELPAGEDPDRLAVELNGIMLAADTNFARHEDPAVLELARQIVRSRLGISGGRR